MIDEGSVLGIDIGYSVKKKSTGVCFLTWDSSQVSLTLENVPTNINARREALKKLVGDKSKVNCVAIDAPIRGSLDEIREYRDAEMMLTRKVKSFIGKPGQASSGNGIKLNRSANSVAKLLIEMELIADSCHKAKIHQKCIAEAFPTSFLGAMLPKESIPSAGARSDVYFEQLLGPKSPRPKPLETNLFESLLRRLLPGRSINKDLSRILDHEFRAALVCAITAVCVVRKQYLAVGDASNGYIILPPRAKGGLPGTQDWLFELIQGNAPTESNSSIIEENDTSRV